MESQMNKAVTLGDMEPLAVRPHIAAKLLGVSTATIYGMRAKGTLHFSKVGTSSLIRMEELHRLLAENIEPPDAKRHKVGAKRKDDGTFLSAEPESVVTTLGKTRGRGRPRKVDAR
jgi:excisionase family DNA binding protein